MTHVSEIEVQIRVRCEKCRNGRMPDGLTCPICNGHGWMQQWVNLAELAERMRAYIEPTGTEEKTDADLS